MLNLFGEIKGGRYLVIPGRHKPSYTNGSIKLFDAVAHVAYSQSCLSQQNIMPKWFKYIN